MEITYSQIEPLIVHAEDQGSKMICEFQSPGSTAIVKSEASIQRLRTMQSQVSRVAKRTVTNQLRRMASRTLRSVLGSGILGRTSSQVFNTASRSTGVGTGYSSEEKQNAILAAFKRVAGEFSYNDATGAWSVNTGTASVAAASGGKKISIASKRPKKQQLSDFEEHLAKYPINSTYDKEILSRMLAEIANADGDISKEERDFLESFVNSEVNDAETLLSMGELSKIECEEVSEKAKSSVYMLAWTIALVDFDMDPAEVKLLGEYADMLGLKEKDKTEAIRKAKYYILEQVISPEIPKNEFFEYGADIGLSNDDAERVRVKFKKRQG